MKRIALMVVAAAIMIVASAYGQEKASPAMKKEPMLKALNLTEEQKKAIKDLTIKTRKENISVSARLKIARLELMELMDQDKPDTKAIDNKLNEITRLRAALMKNRINMVLGIKKILTPEQWQKAKRMRLWRRWTKMRRHWLKPHSPM